MLIATQYRLALLIMLTAFAAALMIWGVNIGSSRLEWAQLLNAIFQYDGSREHIIVTQVRLPRILAGMLIGMGFACAGAIMQALTNNPLASPSLLGVNSGAAFCLVIGIFLFGNAYRTLFVWYAFFGATIAAIITYSIGSIGREGPTPLKLTLVGAMISTFLASITAAILIFDQETLGAVRQWTVGSLKGTQLVHVTAIAPYCLLGLILSLLFGRQLTALSLGSDMARTIGQNVILWRSLCGVCVILLAGSSVALSGPVGFVGLVVPHIARFVVGVDYRWVLPTSALLGGCLVLGADGIFRQFLSDRDIPVGITMAVIGAPFFIYLARYRLRGEQ